MDYQTGIVFSRQHERLLRKTVVDEHGPGTVLHDFDVFLAFIEEGELPLMGRQQVFEVSHALWI